VAGLLFDLDSAANGPKSINPLVATTSLLTVGQAGGTN